MPRRFEDIIYSEGFTDYEEGKQQKDCPYEEKTKERVAWFCGWLEAKEYWTD